MNSKEAPPPYSPSYTPAPSSVTTPPPPTYPPEPPPFGLGNCTYCGEPQSHCLGLCTQAQQSAVPAPRRASASREEQIITLLNSYNMNVNEINEFLEVLKEKSNGSLQGNIINMSDWNVKFQLLSGDEIHDKMKDMMIFLHD